MSMPGCDAQRSNRIELLWRCIGWGGVHHADRFQTFRRALVENRPGSAVVDLLLLLTPITVVGVMDLFAHPAGGKKRLVAVAHRRLGVAVTGKHRIRGSEDLCGAC